MKRKKLLPAAFPIVAAFIAGILIGVLIHHVSSGRTRPVLGAQSNLPNSGEIKVEPRDENETLAEQYLLGIWLPGQVADLRSATASCHAEDGLEFFNCKLWDPKARATAPYWGPLTVRLQLNYYGYRVVSAIPS